VATKEKKKFWNWWGGGGLTKLLKAEKTWYWCEEK